MLQTTTLEIENKTSTSFQFISATPTLAAQGITASASASQPQRNRSKANEQAWELQLVEEYRKVARQFGQRSEAAGIAFEPIFRCYWPIVMQWAEARMGAVHSEELAGETMFTVLERINGLEEITYLRGLVRHSFELEYATLLERLFQAKKLSRSRSRGRVQGRATATSSSDGSQPLKGAVLVSLNRAIATAEGEVETLNLLADESEEADVELAVRRRELLQTLHRLIEQMPPQYREPLVCQWLRGMKIKEVCTELNLTMDQVKHNTAKGLRWLQKHLPGEAQDWLLN